MMKILTALATAGMIAVATVAVPAPAQAGSRGGAVAAGVIGGLAAGAIIGSAVAPRYGYGYGHGGYGYGYGYAPRAAYYGGPYAYSRCHMVRQRVWTNNGPRWRRVRVCN